MKKKIIVMFVIPAIAVVMLICGSVQAKPKYIKEEEVKATMGEFTKALGVRCDYCHTKDRSQDYQDLAGQIVDKDQLASLVHKRIARAMMGLILYINKQEGKNLICISCHQGKTEVEAK